MVTSKIPILGPGVQFLDSVELFSSVILFIQLSQNCEWVIKLSRNTVGVVVTSKITILGPWVQFPDSVELFSSVILFIQSSQNIVN